ncbi:AAA family ATPase [Agrobacterium sp. CMT1]|uniref:AAA family ATPase n=1 Tax=Agrobacterium sp. CMT1 TaxID=3128901 RepID=UPI0030774B12
MFFTVVSNSPSHGKSQAFLTTDRWDDWGKFRTQFYLTVFDGEGIKHSIGSVKIGQIGLQPASERDFRPGQRTPLIGESFDTLSPEFFSLGQGEDYYVSLNALPDDLREYILISLRDVAFNLSIFEDNYGELVMSESLLRDVRATNVRNRLNRITRGDAALTKFQFSYALPSPAGSEPPEMSFNVTPLAIPPTNVHVLIGRNGVGKSRCMRGLTEALLGRPPTEGTSAGTVTIRQDEFEEWNFAGLVLVSFSAFDDFDLAPRESDAISAIQVGLRRRPDDQTGDRGGIKSPSELAVDFRSSLNRCREGLKAQRWIDAVRTLETDDLFAEADVISLLERPSGDEWNRAAEALFKRLSSGHAIILLTITRLVELVDEKTLVLLDEPEGHLHPPLLSAFIRCLSTLLVRRNGVAIIATHSPVVLQEVPKSCAWKLRRSRDTSVVERPTVETFGENIGLLTREVFGLEVTRSGFHQLLQESVNQSLNYAEAVSFFKDQLGMEARAIIKGLLAERDKA